MQASALATETEAALATRSGISAEEGTRDRGLMRGVGAGGMAASIVNGVVGAGIFSLPASMAASAGGAAPFAYLACALAMGAVVMCFAEGGSRVPTSGGAYGTVEAAFGKGAGLLAGVYMWLASVLACGGIAAALCDALGRLAPALAGGAARLLILLAVFGAIAAVNLRGAALAARVISWGTAAKLLPLMLFLVAGGLWIAGGHHPAGIASAPLAPAGFGEAVLLALFAFCGMETPLGASGEVSDPARNVPRATMMAMLFVLLLYVGIQLVAQGLLGGALSTSPAPLADGLARIDPRLGTVLLAGTALSMLIWIGSDVLGAPRVLFAFARDGLLPEPLGRVHRRWRTPHVAILFHSGVAAFLAATGTFVRLAILSTLATAGLYFLACAAALVLRRRGVAVAGPPLAFRLLPAAGWFGMASMVALVLVARWADIAGFAIVTAGSLIFYAAVRGRALAASQARPGS